MALDSAIRDGGTSEAFLPRRIIALRASGREGPGKLLAVLEGAESLAAARVGSNEKSYGYWTTLGCQNHPRKSCSASAETR